MTTTLIDEAPFEESLTEHDRDELLALEATIEAGQETFFEVGAALLAIRDRRLYRECHPTFEAYIQDRWGFSRPRAYQLIEAARVAKNLSTTVDIKGLNERQTRALAPLAPDDQRVVYKFAKATAPQGRITATHLKNLASVVDGVMHAGAIDDGSGAMVPWDDLSAERKRALLEANLTEEAYERQQRQREHVNQILRASGSNSCAPGFSWTLDCERVLAGGVSRWGNQIRNRRRRREPGGRPETPPGAAGGTVVSPAQARDGAASAARRGS